MSRFFRNRDMPAASTLTDAQLGAALAARNTEALAELYDRYGSLAYSVAVRVLGDSGRSEDVVQEVFLKLWNSADRFDAERGSLRTWIMTAVRNRSIDFLRGRGAHERQELELSVEVTASSTASDPWREVAASLERDAIKQALATLPQEQRQAVELAYYGGYSHREIAEMIRVPLSTVKGRMRLALEKMHSFLIGRGLIDA